MMAHPLRPGLATDTTPSWGYQPRSIGGSRVIRGAVERSQRECLFRRPGGGRNPRAREITDATRRAQYHTGHDPVSGSAAAGIRGVTMALASLGYPLKETVCHSAFRPREVCLRTSRASIHGGGAVVPLSGQRHMLRRLVSPVLNMFVRRTVRDLLESPGSGVAAYRPDHGRMPSVSNGGGALRRSIGGRFIISPGASHVGLQLLLTKQQGALPLHRRYHGFPGTTNLLRHRGSPGVRPISRCLPSREEVGITTYLAFTPMGSTGARHGRISHTELLSASSSLVPSLPPVRRECHSFFDASLADAMLPSSVRKRTRPP